METSVDTESVNSAGISPAMVLVMAVATGLAVANIYYAQPLLETLGRSFGVSEHVSGLIVTITQLGYATGLMLLVPLGDLLERRRLIVTITVLTSIALVSAALAPDIEWFFLASLAVGVTSVVVQILVPFAAHLAADHARGRVVGQIMSGLLLGILLARTFSGVVSEVLGWRAMFFMAAAIMLVLAVTLGRLLPRDPPMVSVSYPKLLWTVLDLLRHEPVLRRRIVYGMCVFASFSALWTSLPFLLASPPYDYSLASIGAFGLLGVIGALAASFAGHLHDGGYARISTGFFIFLTILAFTMMGLFPHSLVWLVLGIMLLDFGVQGTQILNQSAIYQLNPEARSRLTTAYMTSYFIGGAAGSAGASYAYTLDAWQGVSIVGAVVPVVAFVFWLSEWRKRLPGEKS